MSANFAARTYGILLVEDDAADALLIVEALNEHAVGRVVARVEDGVAALEHLRNPAADRPDLIVLDLNLPRMNGHETLDALKRDDALKAIPVVVLTTSKSPGDVRGSYQRYANAFVTKPVGLDDFVETVRRIDAFFLETAEVVPES